MEISSPDGLTLETGYGDLCTTLLHLGDLLISNHLSAVVLQPKQRLFIHGLTKAQWTELQKWVKSKEITTILEGLETLFMPYNPVGFVWNLSFTNHIHVASATFTKSESTYGLMIYSNERMRLELNRASGESLVLNLINQSSPALLQGILDFDENAFIYILFRAIFYHCCQDFRHFRNDELPEFFKKSTQDTLQDLLKSGADFTESIRLVLENVEMHQQLLTILYSSPEKFSQLNFEKFPAPLKTLMNTLMKVVYEELRGSPFIAKCVRSIAEGLADGSLKGFIRPPAPENSSSQSTSEPSETPVVSEIQTPVTAPAATPSVNPPQTTSKQSATPVVSEMRAQETSPVATVSVNPPQMATPQPTLPNSNTFSTFVSFFWSMFSGIARWINWFLGKN